MPLINWAKTIQASACSTGGRERRGGRPTSADCRTEIKLQRPSRVLAASSSIPKRTTASAHLSVAPSPDQRVQQLPPLQQLHDKVNPVILAALHRLRDHCGLAAVDGLGVPRTCHTSTSHEYTSMCIYVHILTCSHEVLAQTHDVLMVQPQKHVDLRQNGAVPNQRRQAGSRYKRVCSRGH